MYISKIPSHDLMKYHLSDNHLLNQGLLSRNVEIVLMNELYKGRNNGIGGQL